MPRTDTIRESGEKVATQDLEETPHACMDGWVFLGFEDEGGEEVIEAVVCRRCSTLSRRLDDVVEDEDL